MSMRQIHSLILLFLLISFVPFSVYGAIPAHERAALIEIYNSTNGDNWDDNTGWKAEPVDMDGFAMPGTENNWYGITITSDNVEVISLSMNNLSGAIPSELSDLINLSELNMFNNKLVGAIPPELSDLNNLTLLWLSYNQLTGVIPPELGNLTSLSTLNLSDNQLTGPIPPELGNLNNLARLGLYNNPLAGVIPPELGNLINLSELILSNNRLTGPIPPELGNLNNLTQLGLSYNHLTATIPSVLGDISNLRSLNLFSNQLTGSIPPELGNLNNLENLTLTGNQLTDSIPPELGNLSNLKMLNLSRNQLTGPIPLVLGNLNNLRWLNLYNNKLTGSIPPKLGDLINLILLDLSRNQLTGSIPPELGNLNNLMSLNLYSNQFTGPIPPELSNPENLTQLSVSNDPGPWTRFSPWVAQKDVTQTIQVMCKPEGTFTDIKFDGADGEITLTDRGDGVYVAELDVTDIISNLKTDDANRILAGFVRVYNGDVLEVQYNKFLDVVTSNIPDVTTIQKESDVQITANLFNTIGSYYTPINHITDKFYTYYGDDFDFINIIYGDGRHQNRDFMIVNNRVKSISDYNLDSSGSYGSSGRLKGIMRFPIPGLFDPADQSYSHEIGHCWANHLNFEPFNWKRPHWPLSTLANGIMGWASARGSQGLNFNFTITRIDEDRWQLHADNSPKEYSDLTLYLMGLIPYTEVGTHTIFHNQDQPIGDGEIWVGPVTEIDGYDIVSEMGPRVPDYNNSIKSYKVATILLTQEGLASYEMMQLYDWFASRAELTEEVETHLGFRKGMDKPFYLATKGLATINATIDNTVSSTGGSSSDNDSGGSDNSSVSSSGGGGGCFITTVTCAQKPTSAEASFITNILDYLWKQ